MFKPDQIENILFLDIETAPMAPSFEALPERFQKLWRLKAQRYLRTDTSMTAEELFFEKAGIHAEFARVVCISFGYLQFQGEHEAHLWLRSVYKGEEKQILQDFGRILDRFITGKPNRQLCAHNGKEFDFPFLGRRYLVQGLPLPVALRVQGKKPWELPFLDTMDLWKFGDYKEYTSLDLLAAIFNVPSPKEEMDGSQVAPAFWVQQDVERIRTYCEKDVETTIRVLLGMSQLEVKLIPKEPEAA
ncbi:MAG: ribonuclease H-like domain-containing protein [Bacteroidia bacterium]|nr:ribonuclease H-like domain-containing protein [Bacteroidia bacterium]